MKTTDLLAPLILISLQTAYAQPKTIATSETDGALQYEVAERGAHHKIMQRVSWQTNDVGEAFAQTNSFTELATGLNFKNEKGEWEESREEIEVLPNGAGAAARHGQHKVFFPPDIYDGQIELQTSDGQWLRSRVLGLSYYDKESGKSVLIAEVTNSVGEVQGKNAVIYPEAFTDIRASLRLTYTKRGFEQDVILLEQPPLPEKFGLNPETTRLQVLTEFFNPPQPEKREATVSDSKGGTMVDEQLDFGALRMVPGKAFSLDDTELLKAIPVAKQWLKLEGRDFLIEEVELSAVAQELGALPKARSASLQSNTNAVRQARLGKPILPAQRQAAKKSNSKSMRMAKASLPSKGFVMDYATVNTGQNNYTFKGDTTYYISAPVTLSGTTTFEGGAVIKYAVNAALNVAVGSSIASKSTPYRPVIFTAMHDNSVGEVVSSGTLSGYYANPALSFLSFGSTAYLTDFRISHATTGIAATSGVLGITNAQFVNCQNGISLGNASATLANALFANVLCSLSSLQYASVIAENVTFNGTVNYPMTFSSLAGGAGPCTVTLKNCIVANVTLFFSGPPSGITLNGNHNGFYNAPTLPPGFTTSFAPPGGINPFQAPVGAGNYYLKVNANGTDASGFRNQGATTINATLLEELKKKTTFAPANPPTANPTGTTWNKTAIRDDDGLPDLGYHYEALDYWCSGYTISGSLHTVAPGVAIGLYGSSGFVVQPGAGITMNGQPDSMNRLVWYPSVQEQPVRLNNISTVGSAVFNLSSTSGAGSGGYPPKIVTLRFTDLPMSGYGQSLLGTCYAYNNPVITISDCWLRGVNLSVTETSYSPFSSPAPGSVTLKNNLFERGKLSLYNGAFPYYQNIHLPLEVTLYNNLFWSNTVSLTYADANAYYHPAWAIKDNVYDGVTNTFTGSGSYSSYIVNSYDAFRNTPNPLAGPNHVTLTALTYATGPLGKWYINQASSASTANTALENVGSRTAPAAGLFHYTTKAAQQKEGFSTVDIGMHYVALDGNLATSKPTDADEDLVADYLEDANGNGVVDTAPPAETAWFNTQGEWSASTAMPARGVHAHLLPTGKVLLFDSQNGHGLYNPNPEIGEPSGTPAASPGFNTYCSGHTFMPDGTLFVSGGHGHANWVGLRSSAIYSPLDNFWTRLPNMNEGRWYPTCTTLGNGEVLVTTGNYVTEQGILEEELPQVWNPADGVFRNLNSATKFFETYPFVFAVPPITSGVNIFDVFYAGPVVKGNSGPTFSTWRLSTGSLGLWNQAGSLAKYHTSGSAVLYQPIKDTLGKILVLGGSDYDRIPCDPPAVPCEPDAYNLVEEYDLDQPNLGWISNPDDLSRNLKFARKSQNATVLPDGTVLVTGGYYGPGIHRDPPDETGSVKIPEIWSPVDPMNPGGTWNWTSLAASTQTRIYHSTAVLLPDARVLTTGGEFANSMLGETFSPPFLLKGDQPVITSATFPSVVNYGQTFNIQTGTGNADSVRRITLVRLSSVTHSVNMNQRFRELNFTGANGSYTVTAPANSGQCPPGHYLLYVINNVGVPSVGKMLQILPAGSPEVVMVCPANGGIVQPGTVKVSADVTDPDAVIKVEFYNGATKIGEVQTCTVQDCSDKLVRRHYAITWTPAAGTYTLKARAIKSLTPLTYVDSVPITVTVHSFPTAENPPTLSPVVVPDVGVHPYYSFPVTITATANAQGAGNYISEMDIYYVHSTYPQRLIRHTATGASPTSVAYSWPQARSGLATDVWAIARDNKNCETSTSPLPSPAPDTVRLKIYGGALDTTFNPGGTVDGPNGIVRAVATQPDGKVLIGGDFTVFGDIARPRVARLNANGSLDNTFNPGLGANDSVHCIALQSDGSVIIGGKFSSVNGTGRSRIARFNSAGTLDANFNPNVDGGDVHSIVVQPDGKIILGGSFTTVVGGQPTAHTRNRIARLNSNGTLDMGFNPSITGGSSPVVYSISLQLFQNGTLDKIVLGGEFTTVAGLARTRIARLTASGGLDTSFNPIGTPNDSVRSVAVQADGKVVIGGNFTTSFNFDRSYVARLMKDDGSIDADFNANSVIGGTAPVVHSVVVDHGNRVFMAGQFTTANGINLARLKVEENLVDGGLDDNFRPGTTAQVSQLGADNTVRTLALDPNGLLILGGDFSTYTVSGSPALLSRGPHVARVGGL